MNKPIVPREIQKIFQGRIFTVQVETLTLPNGGEMKADIVRHPGSVVLIPLTEGGDIILVKQYRPAIGRWAWELPAGTLKDGEDPREAAVRECHEEIGMIPTTLEKLGAFFPTPGYCDEEMFFYRLSGLRAPTDEDEEAQPDEDEDIEAVAYTLDQVKQMIASNEIIDLKTIAGVTLLRP
jgi:ADP-ribose pyrophosphatase